MPAKIEPLTWETELPLFSRVMLAQWTGAMLATGVVILIIMAPIFITEGHWDELGGVAMLAGVCIAGLWLLGLLIMAVMFRGRFRARFTVDHKGVRYESLEGLAKKANRVAVVVGALARNPGVAGAGLLAAGRETEQVRWKGAFKAVYKPARHTILLRNSWRTLMWVHCEPDTYDSVAAAVRHYMQDAQTESRLRTTSALPTYLFNTLLVSLACAPLFPLAEEFNTGLFMPIFIYCFALAMVWMIPLFGYAVAGGLAIEALLVGLDLARVRESSFFPGETFTGFQVLSDSDAGLLAMAGAGTAVLLWMSWRYMHGRSHSALIADRGDMEGD